MAHFWKNTDDEENIRERISGGSHPKYVPIDNVPPEKTFDFIYLTDEDTIKYLNEHGRVAFVIRGPPGTRKELLKDLLLDKYKSSITCSADDYFILRSLSERNKYTLRKSHDWCEERLEEYCQQNEPSIIVKNSHIRKWEIELYLNVLRKNFYTVIVCETTRKVKVDTEILEQSNTKGLKKEYFEIRLKQWDEVVPWFTGWFLNPADSNWIFKKSQEVLSICSENEDFKKNYLESENVKDKFCQETVIFCIAAYCNVGKTNEGRASYLNANIQEIYGKMFELNVTAFILFKNMLIAVICLTPEEQKIINYRRELYSLPIKKEMFDPLEEEMKNMKIKDDYGFLNSMVTKVDKKNSKETFEVIEKSNCKFDAIEYGFMLLGRDCKNNRSPLFSELIDCTDLQNLIATSLDDKEKTTVDKMKVYKLQNAIVIELDCCYRCKSIFTGLY